MIAIERHVVEGKENSVCVFIESKGGLGGARLLWKVASSIENSTRKTSFVVVPQLAIKKDLSPQSLPSGAKTTFVDHKHLQKAGLVEAVLQAVTEDYHRAPDVNLRVLILENATALSLSYSMASIIAILRDHKMSSTVHCVLAMFQEQAHSAVELNAVRSIQTCNVVLQPAPPLLADIVYTSQGQRVHVEMVVSLLRHSGELRPLVFVCISWVSAYGLVNVHIHAGRVRVEKQLFTMTQTGDIKACVKPVTVGDGSLESTTSAGTTAY
jgi:hypothetical protein